MFWVSTELQDVPLCEPRVLEQLPARMRKGVGERSIFPSREAIQRIHKVNVRAPAFKKINQLFAQIAVCIRRRFNPGVLRSFLRCLFVRLFLFHSGFPEISTCCGIPVTGCKVVFAKPVLANIFSYSEKVYASPASVPTSMLRLNAAAVGGVTRSSLGTNSRVTAFPRGLRAA